MNSPSKKNQGNPGDSVEYERFLDCIHCGLCTSTCPTFTEKGDENVGPRGRIHLMRAIADGRLDINPRTRDHLDKCLDCRACETACPSGVQYSRILEPFRLAMSSQDPPIKRYDWFRQIFLYRLFPYAGRLRLAMLPMRWMQQLGIYSLLERAGFWKLIPGRLGAMLTLVPEPKQAAGKRIPKFLPAKGRRRAKVAFFVGCAADAMFRATHWATLRVLQENGCDIVVPDGQGCCGAVRYHAGDDGGARAEADANVDAFDLDDIDAVVVNHAGCGAMMKEYAHYWPDESQQRRQQFSQKVRDINEFLDELGLVPPTGRIEAVATYHDACHLGHAQGITNPPRRLLAKIPGLEIRDLPETEICCGSAGTYNLFQRDMADALAKRKLRNIVKTGAVIVIASNAGCLLQIGREVRRERLPLTVIHPMDLLDMSYRGESPLG